MTIPQDRPASMIEIDEVVTAVCRLAWDFYSIKAVTVVDLVARSGARRAWDEVTVERLTDCLAQNPDWFRAWLDYSEDKRTSSGWYVIGRDTTEFRVGYFPESPKRPLMRFDDPVQACAAYVRREVGEIAGLDRGSSRWHRWFSRLLTQ